MATVLITGGAGFVGSHLADQLIASGATVRVFDSLEPQVHGGHVPEYLNPAVEFIHANVLDRGAVQQALRGVRKIVHFAAAVGVGQSMYEIARYSDVNVQGTAVLLQAILDSRKEPGATAVERIVAASSMSIYGEGRYQCPACGAVEAARRDAEQLRRKEWEPRCPSCGHPLTPVATDESKPLRLESIYALTKYVQEEMVLLFGRTYNIPSVALRFFNIYGPRQALSNPYTGVAAIFASQLLQGLRTQVFEDGNQQRDFVSVHDIARATRAALERLDVNDVAINIGSGKPITIRDLGRELARALGKDIEPEITHRFRLGDIRHCFADISRARALLDYEPQVTLEQGLRELVDSLQKEAGAKVGVATERDHAHAHAELAAYGLTG